MPALFTVRLTPSFRRDLERLPAAVQTKVLEEVGRLETNPFGPPPKVKKLKGKGIGQWRLEVRRREDRYEFREHGGQCGNFAVVHATINPAWVRTFQGGHSAIARVSPGGVGSFSLKLYTIGGTPEDTLLDDIGPGRGPTRRLYFHGLLTYDYFSIVKTLRQPDGTWVNPPDWTEVRFPLAFVIFGETEVEEED